MISLRALFVGMTNDKGRNVEVDDVEQDSVPISTARKTKCRSEDYSKKRKSAGYKRVSKWIHHTKSEELDEIVRLLNAEAESEGNAAIYEVTTEEWPSSSDTE